MNVVERRALCVVGQSESGAGFAPVDGCVRSINVKRLVKCPIVVPIHFFRPKIADKVPRSPRFKINYRKKFVVFGRILEAVISKLAIGKGHFIRVNSRSLYLCMWAHMWVGMWVEYSPLYYIG